MVGSTSLRLSFHICKMDKTIPTWKGHCEEDSGKAVGCLHRGGASQGLSPSLLAGRVAGASPLPSLGLASSALEWACPALSPGRGGRDEEECGV